jgi:hypothetical protein
VTPLHSLGRMDQRKSPHVVFSTQYQRAKSGEYFRCGQFRMHSEDLQRVAVIYAVLSAAFGVSHRKTRLLAVLDWMP